MYTVGKGFLCTRLRKANVVYCIPARSLAAIAVLTATVCTLYGDLFPRQFYQKIGSLREYTDYIRTVRTKKQGGSKSFRHWDIPVRKLWHGLAGRLASGKDLNSSHTLLRQERASSCPRVSWELAVHVLTCAATLASSQ